MTDVLKLLPGILDDISKAMPASSHYAFANPIDSKIGQSLAKATSALVTRPVETLLAEAVVLLERCISAQRAKQDIEGRALDFWLEQALNEAKLAARRKQIEAGELVLPETIADKEAEMYQSIDAAGLRQLAEIDKAIAERSPADPVHIKRVDLYGQMAELTAYTRSETAKTIAADLASLTLAQEAIALQSQRAQAIMGEEMAKGNAAIATEKRNYAEESSPAELEKYEADVLFYAQRRSLANSPGSAYNFKLRLEDIQRMFEVDIVAAHSRCQAATIGLAEIYGLNLALPDVTTELPVSALMQWVRVAAELLAAQHDRQQTVGFQLSLISLLSSESYALLLKGEEVTFSLTRDLFQSARLVRIKSITGLVLSDNPTASCLLRVTLPEQATVIRLDGNVAELGQSDIGALYVQAWPVAMAAQGAEQPVNRARSLQNASPIGDWSIRITELDGGTMSEASLMLRLVTDLVA